MTAETQAAVRDLIRICRRNPEATYGQRTMIRVLQQAAGDLSDTAPRLAWRLWREFAENRCAAPE